MSRLGAHTSGQVYLIERGGLVTRQLLAHGCQRVEANCSRRGFRPLAAEGAGNHRNSSGLLIGDVSGNWQNTGARPAGSGPERGVAVTIPSLATSADKEVVIPVTVQGAANKGIVSYEFDLRYDPSVIQPLPDAVDVAGTVSHGLFFVTNAKEPGILRVVVYGATPIGTTDENGLLLNLRFTAVGAVGSISPLTFERIMFNEGYPLVNTTDGMIMISASAAAE